MESSRGQEPVRNGVEAQGDASGADGDFADWARSEDEARADLPPTIYYDLTRYEWYAHGEPLRHAESSYMPDGRPVRMPASGMRNAGQYGGVEVYVQADDADDADTVFVPVFEGFWLPFTKLERQAP